MKILLLGKHGQVGWELQRALSVLGEVVTLDRHRVATAYGELVGDLSDLDGLRDILRKVAQYVIVNAAAYTAVDKAETDRELAHTLNALASQAMAEEAKRLNAWLVHYSTAYVFDGSGSAPWKETAPVAPANYYGATKLDGEQLIQASGCKHPIFRTGWVYAARGNNFAKTMLRLAKDRRTLNVIADQVGVPTGADLKVFLFTPKVFGDERGFFFESFNANVFKEVTGLQPDFVQDNHSRSVKGVLRGLHYQLPPHAQGKLVRVVQGEVFDVAVDIRRSSPTFGQWVGAVLSAENKNQLWIPPGFAHGFVTLSETAEFLYKTTDFYSAKSERCIAWDNPQIDIQWPIDFAPQLSAKDQLGVALSVADVFD